MVAQARSAANTSLRRAIERCSSTHTDQNRHHHRFDLWRSKKKENRRSYGTTPHRPSRCATTSLQPTRRPRLKMHREMRLQRGHKMASSGKLGCSGRCRVGRVARKKGWRISSGSSTRRCEYQNIRASFHRQPLLTTLTATVKTPRR